MKAPALLAAVGLAVLFAPPAARAADFSKLAGTYVGSGVVIDNRSLPTKIRYTVNPLTIKLGSGGLVTGTGSVKMDVSVAGSPYVTVGRQTVTATGRVTRLKVGRTRISGAGTVTFSNGMTFSGDFSVSAKNGGGTYRVEYHDDDFDAKGSVTKKKK